MKPFPHEQINAIDHEMMELRDEVSKLQISLKNAQDCLNALYQKKQDLIADANNVDLFDDTPLADMYGG